MPQLSLQHTSPFLQTLGPHGTVLAGHWITQWCGQAVPGGHVAQTVRHPTLRAARDSRVPAISAEPVSFDPHATTWVANRNTNAANTVRTFTRLPSIAFSVSYYTSRGERNNFC
jgi:hypothetical protein